MKKHMIVAALLASGIAASGYVLVSPETASAGELAPAANVAGAWTTSWGGQVALFGSFRGTWGSGASSTNGGNWDGRR